ncbi:MAG: nucleotide sugar dehydrogenase, partial [Nitrospirae bacterium]|nr:nucleotide sugar dehydrogenase [Nitrospirota bacterium]
EYSIELIDNYREYAPYDAVIIAVRHKQFMDELDFKDFKEISNGSPPILIDIKGAYDKKRAIEEGFLYWRL